MNNNKMIELKKDIFKRAELFIEDMGEFAPFASVLSLNKIKPIVIYDDAQDVFTGNKFIDLLSDIISKQILNKEIQIGAIAYDVTANFKNTYGIYEIRDALCLKISIDGYNWSLEYFPYKLINGKCVWK